jgi:hypothetical protein
VKYALGCGADENRRIQWIEGGRRIVAEEDLLEVDGGIAQLRTITTERSLSRFDVGAEYVRTVR